MVKIPSYILPALGCVPSPFDCYLLNRGLKTLAVRMKGHMSNGLQVARFLEKSPGVEKVLHPGQFQKQNVELINHFLINIFI